MNIQTQIRTLIFVCLPLLAVVLAAQAQESPALAGLTVAGPGQRYTESIPVIDIRAFGYQPVRLSANGEMNHSQGPGQPWSPAISPLNRGGGSLPENPYAIIAKTGPTHLPAGATAVYELTLTNYESLTHTFSLSDTLPSQLAYLPDPASELRYDPASRTVRWEGTLAPGNLDYLIEPGEIALPYLDLSTFGAPNLCDAFLTNGEPCRDVSVTFNLGVNGYTTTIYGELLSQLTVTPNGLILAEAAAVSQPNQWLPDTAQPGLAIAGLWRAADASAYGRWHAAILSGLIAGHDVFYAQWHDIPQVEDSNLTARHAIAVVLNSSSGAANPLAGHIFYIYDNLSDPAQQIARGYTIGIEDRLGQRGATYAFAPCCGTSQPVQGYPPAAGTTLHLRPALFGADNAYGRTFRYAAVVTGEPPETVINTAVVHTSSTNPTLADGWATHYLYVRHLTYLPFLQFEEVQP